MQRKLFVRIARVLHWSVAPGLIAATLLGLYGDRLPYAAGRAAAQATNVYALHKTLGVVVLAVALVFAVWLLRSPRHPSRDQPVPWDVVLARHVHWALFAGMLVLPLSGPALHGNGPSWGFAPILWPFGPYVPGVPRAVADSAAVSAFHNSGWYALTLLALAHVLLWAHRVDRRRGIAAPARRLVAPAAASRRFAWAGGVAFWVVWAGVAQLLG